MKRQQLSAFQLLTDIFFALAMTAFVLFPGIAGYQAIQEAKLELFRLLFGGYLGLMALAALELRLLGRCRWFSPMALWRKASWTQRLVVCYWFLTVLATLHSPLRRYALWGMSRQEGLITITIYCGCFLCVSEYGRLQRWMLDTFGVSMTLFAVLCLLQLRGGNPLGLYPQGYNYFGANIDYPGAYLGTIGNVDSVAALLCLAIPVFWVALVRLKDVYRWWLTLPLTLNLLVLVKMNVQAGLLGILAGTALMLPVVLPVGKRGRMALWLLVAAGAGLCLCLIWTSPRTWGTIYELREVLHGNWEDSFGTGRVYIWKQVLSRVPKHLWLGTGPDTMAAAQIAGYTYRNPELGTSIPFVVDVAHNEYLNVLYHQGLLALLAYLAALVSSAVWWLRRSGQSAGAAALGGAVLCYCIQAFFGFSMCQTAGLFWVIWSLLESVCDHEGELA